MEAGRRLKEANGMNPSASVFVLSAVSRYTCHFKAPRQSEAEPCRKGEILHAHGYSYSSYECCSPGYRPKTLKEVSAFSTAEAQRRLHYDRQRRNEDKARERDFRLKKICEAKQIKLIARLLSLLKAFKQYA